MTKERLFLTGCTGFIGSRLVSELRDKYEIHGLVRNDSFKANTVEGFTVHQGSLDNQDRLTELLYAIRPRIIVHLAAYTPVRFSYSNPHAYTATNYTGTAALVESALKLNDRSELYQFVYASSAEVYGYRPQDDHAWSEEEAPEGGTPYAISKYAGELYVRYARTRGLSTTVLRPTNTYGRTFNLPDEARGYFVEKTMIAMLQDPHGAIMFDGYPDSSRRWMHADDHVSAYKAVIGEPKALNEIFNVTPFPHGKANLKELTTRLSKLTGFTGRIGWGNDPRPVDPNFLDIDWKKTSSRIGWQAKVPLQEGLARQVEYWREKLVDKTR